MMLKCPIRNQATMMKTEVDSLVVVDETRSPHVVSTFSASVITVKLTTRESRACPGHTHPRDVYNDLIWYLNAVINIGI